MLQRSRNLVLLAYKTHFYHFPKRLECPCYVGFSVVQPVSPVRGFKNFGHSKKANEPRPILKVYAGLIIAGTIACFLNWEGLYNDLARLAKFLKSKFKVDALAAEVKVHAQPVPTEEQAAVEEEEEQEIANVTHPQKGRKRSRPGFRERKICEYENRVRAYSTPDKIFRYFATLKVYNEQGEFDIFMTPEDFLRSLTPGIKQPDGFGLDKYKRLDIHSDSFAAGRKHWAEFEHKKLFEGENSKGMSKVLSEDSIFYKLSTSGLISFSDYIFLLTILSASRRHFEIAFRMFDLNGDGNVDYEEFEKVQTIIRQQTSFGMRHRDHMNTGSIYKGVSSALGNFFFGPKLEKKLTVETFLDFQKDLQREILTLEFHRKDPSEDGLIREVDFAELLLTYAGLSEKKQSRMMKRIKKYFKGPSSLGICLEDYLQFFHFINNINDVDTALTFYHIAGASIDPATLKHVAKTVAHVDLRDHVINVIFTLFDENMDGQLSNKEFVNVMKERLQRGLEKPKDTGFVKLMNSVWKCAMLKKPVLLDV